MAGENEDKTKTSFKRQVTKIIEKVVCPKKTNISLARDKIFRRLSIFFTLCLICVFNFQDICERVIKNVEFIDKPI